MSENQYIIKIMFNIQPEEEDILLASLQENLGHQVSIYQEPEWNFEQVHIYVPLEEQEAALSKICNLLMELNQLELIAVDTKGILLEKLVEEDWMNHWKEYFKPILVGEKLQITPFWYPENKERINLMLEPKMGFGTGQHATTFLCLEAMEKEDLHHKRILDLGAGSGILGVSAVLLGAKSALLLEIDKLSIESCKDTVSRNHVENQVQVLNEDVFTLEKRYQGPYDIAFINIIAEVIVDILDLPWIKHIPTLFLSGILLSSEHKVLEKIEKTSWKLKNRKVLNDWVMLEVKSPYGV